MGKIEISQQIYNDALKASGDESLAKEFALAYATLPNLAKRPTNEELLEVRKPRCFFSFLVQMNKDVSQSACVLCLYTSLFLGTMHFPPQICDEKEAHFFQSIKYYF